jgi:putative tricarboxylic transport membrane protein
MITQNITEGIYLLYDPLVLLMILTGVSLGIILGALPGLGAGIGMAIAIPFTVVLEPHTALIFLISMYVGGMYGGCIPAILLNIPGTAGAVATTFDGYPMSRNGQSLAALTISAIASGLGGILSAGIFILISGYLLQIVLAFGSPDYFLVAILGLLMIAVVVDGFFIKGVVAGSFGLLIATVGMSQTVAETRYTFGTMTLFDGIHFIPALIGIFAIGEMLKLSQEKGGVAKEEVEVEGARLDGAKTVSQSPVTFFKSMLIGKIVGAIPGAGSSVANIAAYAEEKRANGSEHNYGEGEPRGVIASEAANSGNLSGALIPTLAFGIPGSGSTAILLGGLIMHGLIPGPGMFGQNADITFAMILSIMISSLIIIVFGILFVTQLFRVTNIDTHLIIPLVCSLSIIGAYVIRVSWLDVLIVVAFGFIGYYMSKHNYSIVAFILGIVLGPIAETNLSRTMEISDWSINIFFTGYITTILSSLVIIVVFSPVFYYLFDKYVKSVLYSKVGYSNN